MNSKSIKFVTSNNGKFEEVARWAHELAPSLVLEQVALDIPEIQSLDAYTIGSNKAKTAWNILKEPLLIDDGGIYLKRFNNFPGPLSKYVYEGIGLDGFWMLAHDDPRAYFFNVFVYKDNEDSHEIFDGICSGTVKNPEHADLGHAQLPFAKLLIPDGMKESLAQLRGTEDEKNVHHRYQALRKFLMWFKEKRVSKEK